MPIRHTNIPGYPPMHPSTVEMGSYMQYASPTSSVFNGNILTSGVKPLIPIHDIDVKPCSDCPKNLVIFDQTQYESQIVFHPEISFKFFHHGFDVYPSVLNGELDAKDSDYDRSLAYPKEDSDDTDALLIAEDEEYYGNTLDDDDGDDVVSTARTDTNYMCNSPDSCSNYESNPKKSRPVFQKSSGNCDNDKKRHKTMKMVNALRGIVPGANQLNTVGVLDEAVRYLKSLKVEMDKLDASNSKV